MFFNSRFSLYKLDEPSSLWVNPGETAVFINDHYIIMKLIFIQYRDDRSTSFLKFITN